MTLWGSQTVEVLDDMAKQTAINVATVTAYLDKLKGAGLDKAAFDIVLTAIKADSALKAVDVCEIARVYTGTKKVPSKASAYTMMTKHNVSLARASAKAKIAATARPL